MSEDRISITREQFIAVYNFFVKYDGFRSLDMCSKITGIDFETCKKIHAHIHNLRLIGGYYFEEVIPPQKYMNYYIKNNFPDLTIDSHILEIGPGNYPLFNPNTYKNWMSIDKNYEDGVIKFEHREWGKDTYPEDKIIKCGWENISDVFEGNKFDYVVSSHTFEHVEQPITVLKETCRVLKPDGYLIMFVPDGYMCDFNLRLEITHTLYLTKSMIDEFFEYAGGFSDIGVKIFRPDYDIVITAKKDVSTLIPSASTCKSVSPSFSPSATPSTYTSKSGDDNTVADENKPFLDILNFYDKMLPDILDLADKTMMGSNIDTYVDVCFLTNPDKDLIKKASDLCDTLVFIGGDLDGVTDPNIIIKEIHNLTMRLFFILEKWEDCYIIVCER